MYCDGDIIQINEDYRLKVELDHDSENPLDWGWGTEIHEIDNYRIWRGWEREPWDDLVNMARELHYKVRRGELTTEKRDRAIHLYMVWLGDDRNFEIRKWHGYSESDWATVLVLWDPEKGGDNVYEAWAAWRRGDVYTVVEQIRKVYVSTDDPEDVYEDWFDGDSLSGCFLEDGYTPEDVAREYFLNFPSSTDKEK